MKPVKRDPRVERTAKAVGISYAEAKASLDLIDRLTPAEYKLIEDSLDQEIARRGLPSPLPQPGDEDKEPS